MKKSSFLFALSPICAMLAVPGVWAGVLTETPLAINPTVPSNVIFPISVEFPTAVTASYFGTNDYSNRTEYLGIFNPDKCYEYQNVTGSEWFKPVAMATDRKCNNAWSGNFLNWASMTGLDQFRVAMTGGNRYRDTETETVLERTHMSDIPDESGQLQGGEGSNFPHKTPSAASLAGAVPTDFANVTRIVNLHNGVKMSIAYRNRNGNNATTTFYVRAVVCDQSVGGLAGMAKENCVPYGPESRRIYKPVGQIQKYGEKMRFGVFSYFISNSIDNAVMRSKAKFVAPRKWTASGSTDNPNKEWDAETGIFVTNPDPADAAASRGGAVANSGVINYINKFGKDARNYKRYDNIGKLWYESMRYLRGLPPTPDFYRGATRANGDGFPVITTWDDPVQYSCQKNFLMGMGDTHTWCDKRLPGGKFTSVGSAVCSASAVQSADIGSLGGDADVNVAEWTDKIDALEPVNNMSTGSIQNSASYYMAGLSYWAAYHGIRPANNLSSNTPSARPEENIKVKSFFIDVLENKDLGENRQYWFTAKYGGAGSFDAAGKPQDWSVKRSFSDPFPVRNNIDWPKTLLPAGDPQSMRAAVDAALSAIEAESAQLTGSTPSSVDLGAETGSGVNAYATSVDPKTWSGDVVSKIVSTANLTVRETPEWKASERLPSWSSRRILTFNDGLKKDGTETAVSDARRGVTFDWNNLSPRQQAFLNRDPARGDTADTLGSARLNFIRGDAANEGENGQKWRKRASRLGDFINSAPVLVNSVAYRSALSGDAGFAKYRTATANRTPVLYVGGNDGMLHAFNADANSDGTKKTDSGKEILAYVPSAVYSKLNKLSWVDYSHLYYVDATPVVADAQVSSGCTASDAYACWRSVLVGGLGAGGQGIYALNVTDPSRFGTAPARDIVMWEFTDRDDADLGFTFARPFVRKMNNGKWAVIIGNGYNSKDMDGDVGAIERPGSGEAALFILFMDGPTGSNRAWVRDTDYIKIGLKTSAGVSVQNGLSSVNGVDEDNDGDIDYLYAGDRLGNLWKIDVSSGNSSDWSSAYGSVANPTPLFTAKTGSGEAQQVTTQPMIGRHPKGGYLVMFGTGSYVDQSDAMPPFVGNAFYGIWDKNDASMNSAVPIARARLQKQKTLAKSGDYTLFSDCQPQYESGSQDPAAITDTCPADLQPTRGADGKVGQQLGWALELNHQMVTAPGERYISNTLPTLDGRTLVFKTLATSNDPCKASGQDHYYTLDYRSGGRMSSPVFIEADGNKAKVVSIDFGAFGTLPPSGKAVATATGQNPQFVGFEKQRGNVLPTVDKVGAEQSYSGCDNFVPGRPCFMQRGLRDLDTGVTLNSLGRGTVSWRQLP